jgi:hypothetical protein
MPAHGAGLAGPPSSMENTMRSCVIVLLLLSTVGAAQIARGQAEAKTPQTFTESDKAGPDYAIQGEYEGDTADHAKLGAQVTAQGSGKFAVAILPGGLPGAGWDGKQKVAGTAETKDGKTSFSGEQLSGEIAADRMSGKLPDGRPFTLNHVLRESPTRGARPPEGAIVLFDGSSAAQWNNGKLVDGNLLSTLGDPRGITSKRNFGDIKKLHVEFRLPFMPYARGQSRSNSGVYLADRYEVQVLDSFGLKGESNECGGIYSLTAPSVNMCFPPLSWQTYDIEFTAPRFGAAGKKTANARMTVLHNGVKIHDDVEVKQTTVGAEAGEAATGPIQLQNHGNPVYYRHIWVVPGN